MPEQQEPSKLPHLLIIDTATTELYTRPKTRAGEFKLHEQNRQTHGAKLLRQLNILQEEAEELGRDRAAFGLDVGNGIYIQFESEPGFELKLESLESSRSGIELVAVKQLNDKTLATVFVPEGKLSHFIKLISEYYSEETKKGKPKNQKLIDNISEIKRAILEALWTDDPESLPAGNQEIWWEVWLRVGDDRDAYLNFFKEHAAQMGLEIGNEEIKFPDRTVVVARGNKSHMSRSINLLNCIAELRKAKETADDFTSMTPTEQTEWVAELLSRISVSAADSPAICILDTGVNNGHPLLTNSLNPADMHSYEPSWGVTDHKGHGTEMAGLALYGDLTALLLSNEPVVIKHRLESVKILPPVGVNPPHLYGDITAEAIARAEISASDRQRIVCMAVTTIDSRDRGQPSAWSAALDTLSSGADDDQRRLIIVSGGNSDELSRHNYPNSNQTDGIHDPGQSWNALTVGAYTQKSFVNPTEFPGWRPLAPTGDLSPSSSTSMIWQRPWPIKPDIVMEGGNMALNPDTGTADYLDSLSLLTTHGSSTLKPFVTTGDTSAATALVARMAAILQAKYPEYWPETLRALLVHTAEWTDAMKARFEPLSSRSKKEALLRYCGFGVPNFDEMMWSAQNSLTLVAQDSLQPFDKVDNSFKTHDLNIHNIPWPEEVLQELGETIVEMKVTLSYFIEPNPARRGWTRRYRYTSHGLRFEVKTPEETLEQFRRRINQAARDEENGKTSSSDANKWFFGPDLRGLGSLHTDRWTGTAAELAQRRYIAVYPVIGWWRERHQLGRWGKRARYSLVVTIKTPSAEVDVYTPVANIIRVQVPIVIS